MIWTGAAIGFYLLAIVALVASLRVITCANPVHALLNMIVLLMAVAGVFFTVGAPFAGALEIIVYAGAIMVLFVFVVMMLNLGHQNAIQEKSWLTSSTWAVPTGLAAIVGVVLVGLIGMQQDTAAMSQLVETLANGSPIAAEQAQMALGVMGTHTVDAKAIGATLFTEYLLLVEVAGFLLLAALVAAYHLAQRALDDENVSHNSLRADTPQLAAAPTNSERQDAVMGLSKERA